MSTVCSASLLWRLVDLNVLDNKVGGVQTLRVGVGLSVLEQGDEELCALDWPSRLAYTKSLACISVSIIAPTMHPRTWQRGLLPHVP